MRAEAGLRAAWGIAWVRRLGGALGGAAALLALGMLTPAPAAQAQPVPTPVALRDRLPIGSNGLCEAQIQAPQPGDGLFDRRYTIVCRDAAAPVGRLLVLEAADEAGVLAGLRPAEARCEDLAPPPAVPGLSGLRAIVCTDREGLRSQLLLGRQGNRLFAASGVAVYADALRLGLGNLASNRLLPGEVQIPLTLASDARAFARAQAEALAAELALVEAYRRANSGNFAEAAEFFASAALALDGRNAVEAQLNAALQHSNLGNFGEAAQIFITVQQQVGDDPVLARLARNFEALDALNRESHQEALLLLDSPLPPAAASLADDGEVVIPPRLADRLALEQDNAITRTTGQLSLLERADLLDAQASHIRATALARLGNRAEARRNLEAALRGLAAVREGRVVSVVWLRAQILGELAEDAELSGELARADALHTEAVALLERFHPSSPALASARAMQAGFLMRSGRTDEALALYRALVDDGEGKPSGALRRLLAPYFALLAQRGGPQAAEEMFAASQLLQRPGLAQTQAVLSRELSGGSDEAGQLFRQAVNIGRAIEQTRAELAQLELDAERQPPPPEGIAELRQRLEGLRSRQQHLQQQLAQYPRYRAITDARISLSELAAVLGPDEAYLKLVMLEDAAYAIHAGVTGAGAYRLSRSPDELGRMVATLRDSIAVEQAGQTFTFPFELELARELYTVLLGPIDSHLARVRHLVFEPDGELLRLPLNLLVTDDASVSRYLARAEDPDGDPYDYRDTAWLGRRMEITTAVAPAAFRDVRQARRSSATRAYLGLGSNQPLAANALPNRTTRSGGAVDERCQWTAAIWNSPIRPDELHIARAALGQGALLTGAEFNDTAMKARDDLDDYRILHFATHGLVTAPEPDCPPRPALLTSFGAGDSDGLLSFAEIFDLKLDADLVILSACNTAGVGGLVATREAGISGGGDFALDGLVRAFVGAGGRTVIASHWPVPDDFDATNRLISGLFTAGDQAPVAAALRQAQLALMDDAATSHPFYWAAFAVVGDGAVVVQR